MRFLAEWLLILAVLFVVGGSPAPDVNETHYLAKARHYWDPTFCVGDAFLDSSDAHLVFYWSVGWLTQWFSLPTVAWVGRLATWSLLALGWMALARQAALPPFASALSAALLAALIDRGNFAGEWVFGGAEGKTFAYAFVWFGLAALMRGRWTWAWTALGAACAWHVLVGGWATLTAAGVWLAEPRSARPSLGEMWIGLATGLLLGLVGLLPALGLDRGVTNEQATEAARIYVFERLPHHLAPLSLKPSELHAKSIRFGVLLAVWGAMWAIGSATRLPPMRRLWRFSAGCVALFAVGLGMEASLLGRPDTAARLLRFYWFRMADVAVPMAIALTVVGWAGVAAARQRRGWQALVAVLIIGCGWHLLTLSAQRWHRPWPPADRRVRDLVAWTEACDWIREHAPPEALFFIPRDHQSFKWYAHRGDVGNWKDVPQDAAGVTAWFARCRDLYEPMADDGTGRLVNWPGDLTDARIEELAETYRFHYVVTASGAPLHLACVYQNEGYAVYWVPTLHSSGAVP